MTASASPRVLEAQERLTHIRRLIDSTTCEARHGDTIWIELRLIRIPARQDRRAEGRDACRLCVT